MEELAAAGDVVVGACRRAKDAQVPDSAAVKPHGELSGHCGNGSVVPTLAELARGHAVGTAIGRVCGAAAHASLLE